MSDHPDVPGNVLDWFKGVSVVLEKKADKFTCMSEVGADGKEKKQVYTTFTMGMQPFCDIMAMGGDGFPCNGLLIRCDNGDNHLFMILKVPGEESVSTDFSLRTMSLPRKIYFNSHDREGYLTSECVGQIWKVVRLDDTLHIEFRPADGVIPDSFWSENKTWVTNMCALSSPNLVSLS